MENQLKIIYLHGFNSSSESKKSKILESFLEGNKFINLESPNLETSPRKAICQIEKIIKEIRCIFLHQELPYIQFLQP